MKEDVVTLCGFSEQKDSYKLLLAAGRSEKPDRRVLGVQTDIRWECSTEHLLHTAVEQGFGQHYALVHEDLRMQLRPEWRKKMIVELLDISRIELDVDAGEWREAICMAGRALVQSGKIGEEYVEGTIRAVEELGSYIVIMPGAAFAHFRPDASVKEDCMQLIRLKTPVNFGSSRNDPVKLLMESDRIEEIQGLLAEY